jgi:hypothetical protein
VSGNRRKQIIHQKGEILNRPEYFGSDISLAQPLPNNDYIPTLWTSKKEIKPLLALLLFFVMLSFFIDFLYPMLKAWLF